MTNTYPVPPAEDGPPQNLDEIYKPLFPIDSYTVAEHHPQRDGKGQPDAVLLMFDLKGLDYQFAFRFKSAGEVNRLIAILHRHAQSVWGP